MVAYLSPTGPVSWEVRMWTWPLSNTDTALTRHFKCRVQCHGIGAIWEFKRKWLAAYLSPTGPVSGEVRMWTWHLSNTDNALTWHLKCRVQHRGIGVIWEFKRKWQVAYLSPTGPVSWEVRMWTWHLSNTDTALTRHLECRVQCHCVGVEVWGMFRSVDLAVCAVGSDKFFSFLKHTPGIVIRAAYSFLKNKWATAGQNQQNDLCAQQRLRSA